MATLKERFQAELNDALRAHDETKKTTLRMLMAAVRNAEIEARRDLDDDGVIAVVQKQVKQRRESIVEFQKGGRDDLVAKEAAEMVVLEAYLPTQAERGEIVEAARKVVAETGASGARDIGKGMP